MSSSIHRIIIKKTLSKYTNTITDINNNTIDDLIYNEKKHLVAIFKDYLIFNESCDFLSSYYSIYTSIKMLLELTFSESSTIFRPSYAALKEYGIMNKNAYKKQKIMRILQMDDAIDKSNNHKKRYHSKYDIDIQDKLIESSMVANSLASSQQVSQRTLQLDSKDEILRGCYNFLELNEMKKLFSNNCNQKNNKKCNQAQANTGGKFKKNPLVNKKNKKKQMITVKTNPFTNNKNSNIINGKIINQTSSNPIVISNKRNKNIAAGFGLQYKSFRKASLTLNLTNENELGMTSHTNYTNYTNHGFNEKNKPISLRYANGKHIHNKLSLKHYSTINRTNQHHSPSPSFNKIIKSTNTTITHSNTRDKAKSKELKLQKSRTFSKNETNESLTLLQKEKALLRVRMKKNSLQSPHSSLHQNTIAEYYSVNPFHKKNLRIDIGTTMRSTNNSNISTNVKQDHSALSKNHRNTSKTTSHRVTNNNNSTYATTNTSTRLSQTNHHHERTLTNIIKPLHNKTIQSPKDINIIKKRTITPSKTSNSYLTNSSALHNCHSRQSNHPQQQSFKGTQFLTTASKGIKTYNTETRISNKKNDKSSNNKLSKTLNDTQFKPLLASLKNKKITINQAMNKSNGIVNKPLHNDDITPKKKTKISINKAPGFAMHNKENSMLLKSFNKKQ